MLTTLKTNRSLTFYQQPSARRAEKPSSAYAGGIAAMPMANVSLLSRNYTTTVNQALSQLKSAVIARGKIYANDGAAQRGGYMAEDFVAESYNLDAAIKRKVSSAKTPKSTANGSADIEYDGGKTAGLKFLQEAESSAKAQTDPKYRGQDRVVPADQVDKAKEKIGKMIERNIKKGRTEAAQVQQEAQNRITDRICGDDGVESTPLTKKQDKDLAEAIGKDKNGQTVVNQEKIDKTLEDTGVTKKAHNAVLKNELRGLGIAVAIGAGVGLTIGVITTLAQTGVTPDSLKLAAIEGAKSGVESGVLSGIGYGIGRTIGRVATDAIIGQLKNAGFTVTEKISEMVNMGVVGAMTIVVFSAYQFIKLKRHGAATRDALTQVGKQALFSLTVLAVSIAAQGIWGGHAGIIVSISSGIILIAYTVIDSVHQRRISEQVRVYMIDKCYPVFAA